MPQSQIGAQGGVLPSGAPEITQAQQAPANPTATASTVPVMMGLAGAITPQETGRILLIISGDVANATIADGASVQAAFGTGAAPANGAAAAGTVVGGKQNMSSAAAAQKVPFSCNAVITGLTVGTPIWLDAQVAAITGGTASIADVSISAVEF